VELRGPQARAVHRVDDTLGMIVAEHPDGQDLGREAAGDVVHALRGDLAG
jgi:hypothetical protein